MSFVSVADVKEKNWHSITARCLELPGDSFITLMNAKPYFKVRLVTCYMLESTIE